MTRAALLDELEKIAKARAHGDPDPREPTAKKVLKYVVAPAALGAAGVALGRSIGPRLADKMLWPPDSTKRAIMSLGLPALLAVSGIVGSMAAARHADLKRKAFPELAPPRGHELDRR